MNKDYKKQIRNILPLGEDELNIALKHLTIKEIPSKTILLSEGDIATKLFLVFKGCLRTYFVKDIGVEITAQFFIENQMVSSFESAMTNTPSRQYIDTIENSIVGFIEIQKIKEIINKNSKARDYFNEYLISRLIYYMNNHASFILDKPERRYIKLMQENPELVSRLPQQYIASYLGITPVSLSRIRTRLKQINNC